MKKILVLLVCCLVLGGCGNGDIETNPNITEESATAMETTEKQIQSENLYETENLIKKNIGYSEYMIPEIWEKFSENKENSVCYSYEDYFVFVCNTNEPINGEKYRNLPLDEMEIALEQCASDAETDFMKFKFGSASWDSRENKNEMDIEVSGKKAYRVSEKIIRNESEFYIDSVAIGSYDEIYVYTLFSKLDRKNGINEFESLINSIVIQEGKDEIFETFKQNIIDMSKGLGSSDIEKELYYNQLLNSSPSVKKLTLETWNDSQEFNNFLISIGYFYTHYEKGTFGYELGNTGFEAAKHLMQGDSKFEEDMDSLEGLLKQIKGEEKNTPEEPKSENSEPTELSTGNYVVGEDIPVGKYDIVGVESGNIYVSSNGGKSSNVLIESIKPGETVYKNLKLEDGYIVEIVSGGKVRLETK